MEVYATENKNKFTGATTAKLQAIQPSLKSANFVAAPKVTANSYIIEIKGSATSTQKFIIENKAGVMKFSCVVKGVGGCPQSGIWGS